MKCVIHYKACKCREEKFKHLDKENIDLHQTVAEQWTEIQKLKNSIDKIRSIAVTIEGKGTKQAWEIYEIIERLRVKEGE